MGTVQEKITDRSVVARRVAVSTPDGKASEKDDFVTAEEPLQIVLVSRKKRKNYAVIMRTPVHDFELCAGFLFSEGIIRSPGDIESIRYDSSRKADSRNVAVVMLADSVQIGNEVREFAVNSSCGVCGKSSINDIFLKGSSPVRTKRELSRELVLSLPDRMAEKQEIFRKTGGIHAAGLFDYDGNLLFVAEDVGRHNAVDKIVGHMLLNGLMGKDDYIMQVSGRAGFEIVQKAAGAGISAVSSVSAPSSLAVETADSFNITLVCFVRRSRFNVYSHRERFGDI